MAVGMGMAMGVAVIVALGAGMRRGRHSTMLYYNITKVHGALTAVFPKETPAGPAAGTFPPQASPDCNANEKGRQLDAAALLAVQRWGSQAFENSSST
jgi:hypothetical protein